MSRILGRRLAPTAAGLLLAMSIVGSAMAYVDVHIPPAACESVLAGIAHFQHSLAPAQMQQTPAWGNTSRFVYDRCE